MPLDIIKRGTTSWTGVRLFIFSSSTFLPLTTVTFESSGIDLWYARQGADHTSITEATLAAADSAYSSGGFIHISDGWYRLDAPDAALASSAGVNFVDFGGTVTGGVIVGCRIKLVDFDYNDSVRAGLTALPNAAADTPGGLPISDDGGLDLDALYDALLANRAEPGQGDPAASTSVLAKIDYLYKAWRNKKTQTSSQWSLYNDAGDTVDQKATVSDNGTTTTKEEIGTGA